MSQVAKASNEDWVAAATAELPALLTIAETATYLRMSMRQVYRLADAGRIVMISKGGEGSRRLVPKAAIAKYLRQIGAGESL